MEKLIKLNKIKTRKEASERESGLKIFFAIFTIQGNYNWKSLFLLFFSGPLR